MDLDKDKLAEHALAILSLTAFRDHSEVRAWKALSWDLMDDLFERGWIHDPKRKAKSFLFTPEGAELANRCLRSHFSSPDSNGSEDRG